MNRPIKFRIWHKDLKKMLYPPYGMDSMPYLRDSTGNHVYIPQGGKIRENGPTPMYPLTNTITTNGLYYINGMLQDIELMQFTGLKDFYKNDIYEGDIVELGYNERKGATGKVIFEYGAFIVESKGGCIYQDTYWGITAGELKGNIFENPELLKI